MRFWPRAQPLRADGGRGRALLHRHADGHARQRPDAGRIDPAQVVGNRDSIRLAFVAALQVLALMVKSGRPLSELAKKAMQQLIAQNMRGGAVEVLVGKWPDLDPGHET